ncbi:143_t:CDS:2, partial [Paraglomus brasilianum]
DPGSLEASEEEEKEELECPYPKCDQSFDSKHLLIKHLRECYRKYHKNVSKNK